MFSLPFRKTRRKSEPVVNNPEAIAIAATSSVPGSDTNNSSLSRIHSNTSNLSVSRNGLRRTRSRRKSHSNIFSKRLSFFHNNSSDDLNSLATSNNSDFETVELSRFKSLNYDKFKKESLQYLKFHGFSAPKILNDVNYVRISVSSTGENVFLPSVVNYNEEDVDNLDLNNGGNDNRENHEAGVDDNFGEGTDAERREATTLTEETTQRGADENEGEPVTHTFAIVVSLTKPTQVTNITTQLQSTAKILWPDGIPYDRNIKAEVFELGQLSWDLSLSNYSYYVPYNDSEDAMIDGSNELNSVSNHNDPSRFVTETRIPFKKFQENTIDQITRGPFVNPKKDNDPFIIKSLQTTGSISYPPGDYIFTLPVLFPPTIAESLITQNSIVSYKLRTIVSQKNRVYNLGENEFNVIRGPPSNAETTTDKPVYVNKVWNDSLSYEVSFPKKYVTVGSHLPIKLKFAPMIKDISIRRIRINVLEKVTYCSKDLRFEYDETTLTKNENIRKTGSNEKVLPLLEIRTRSRTELALREVLLKDLLRDDNLLSGTYNNSGPGPSDDLEVIGQLRILANLSFIRPLKINKELQAKHSSLAGSIYNQDRHKSQIDKSKTTKVTNQGADVEISTYFNEIGEGLHPDSSNNRFIQVDHKLQIAIRLSKKDAQGKMHHYEVMIDTPIYFLNSSCTPSNVDLPPYVAINDDDHEPAPFYGNDLPPTFEEAMSPMNSPSLTPYQAVGEETIDVLSRTSTIASTGQYHDGNYDNIDHLITGTSELAIPDTGRRRSSVTNDILMNLRRTATHNSNSANRSLDSGVGRSQNGEASINEMDGESEGEQHRREDAPPTYTEAMPLMSEPESDSDVESLSSLEDEESYSESQNEGTDLTDQFNRGMFDS